MGAVMMAITYLNFNWSFCKLRGEEGLLHFLDEKYCAKLGGDLKQDCEYRQIIIQEFNFKYGLSNLVLCIIISIFSIFIFYRLYFLGPFVFSELLFIQFFSMFVSYSE